jgi:hypothetical protein
MISILLPPVLGALAGAVASMAYNWWRTNKEYGALIFAFATEFVSQFELCAMYFGQSKENYISYSSLFSFVDASSFSKFASVSRDAEVPAAIIELKARYFQIQPHIEEASKYALEASRATEESERQKRQNEAFHAQAVAMTFFLGEIGEIEKLTALIVNSAKKVSDGPVAWDLASRLSTARMKIKKLRTETG